MADPRPEPVSSLSFENARAEYISRVNAIRSLGGQPGIVDDHAANPHLMWVEVTALYTELMGKTIDNRVLATLVVTARNLEDAVIASESLGYDWRTASPAKVTIELDFGVGGWGEDIIFEDDRQWLADPEYIQDGQVAVLAGTQFASISAVQKSVKILNSVSTGVPGQVIPLPDVPAMKRTFDGEVSVLVDGAIDARIVDRLFELRSDEVGAEYRVLFDESAIITLGDGVNGEIIALGKTVQTAYNVTLGVGGRIGPNVITAPIGPVLDVLAVPVTGLTVTQPVGSSGGQDRETLESIKFNAPRSLRTLKASISRPDFETNAQAVGGVLRALPITRDTDESVAPNITLVLVAAAPAIVGETTLFTYPTAEDPIDGTIDPATWLIITSTWQEVPGSPGVLVGDTISSLIQISNFIKTIPLEVRTTITNTDTTETQIRIGLPSSLNDYVLASITADGGGNGDFKVAQVVGGSETDSTVALGVAEDPTAGFDVTFRFTLEDGLELLVNDVVVVASDFAVNTQFFSDLVVQFFGKVEIEDVVVASLLDLPLPNQELLDDVQEAVTSENPTLVSHNVDVGPIQVRPINISMTLLTILQGFTVTQVQVNVKDAIDTFLSITRREEDDEFANKPGVSIFLSELVSVIEGALGTKGVAVAFPIADEIAPNPQELLIPGEIVFL